MPDPIDAAAPPADYKKPKGRSAPLSDLVLIVRPPGQWQYIRTFTEEQAIEAEAYAAQFSTTVERLG